ncbi:hypothetical protein AYM02_01460 [Coxiella burnetii]|uniref:CBU_2013 family Dot/Icm T4SS effector n=1 Tax=Coxiella burnetii TaxID=777 RepID=UPI0003253F06|nr:CBU_2013 family Dot/Icm T4SS effector [Coxiella burnetii]AML48039.1 hypothetical protein AUR58_01745 [Coxiella burnetii]AML54063.1 hypothetical protein AYM38_01430 [Coxiella burnetii]ATN68024.1 hypothetical protein AYM00_01475 [Coxiella burnetii]ATN69954.1 hypothetical protein AYM02_01460 [Coxiella burnetii]ATN71909.1 hypothetical protein AYM11_01410 [Coxiella burnetii]
MPSINLTTQQQRAWQELMRLEADYGLSLALRHFAANIIEQKFGLKISVGGNLYQQFDSEREKAAFVKKIRTSGKWGNDTVLACVLDNLGYQAAIYLKGQPPYLTLTHNESTQLRMDIANDAVVDQKAQEAGSHWLNVNASNLSRSSVANKSIPGDCLYEALALQISYDRFTVGKEYPNTLPNGASNEEKPVESVNPSPEAYLTIEKAAQLFEAEMKKADAFYAKAVETLQAATPSQLRALYDQARIIVGDTDSYLKYAPIHAVGAPDKATRQKFQKGIEDEHIRQLREDCLKALSRKQLIHILAREVWRNPAILQAPEIKPFYSQINKEQKQPALSEVGLFAPSACGKEVTKEYNDSNPHLQLVS